MDEWDRVQRLFIYIGMMGLLVVAIAQLGEHLGWWNDFGEAATIVGVVVSALAFLIALLVGATKGQVRRVVASQAGTNTKLDQANTKLDQANGKHDETNRKLEALRVLLVEIRDRLPP